MPDGLVQFDNVWKRFKRGVEHDSLRDLLPALARRFAPGSVPAKSEDAFWALRDVSFSVKPGEVLGIIGHNGAGKSTVLKLLNRIMEPTAGVAEVRGRVGALIEISAGFHPDLTGRQNVFLQGAILGMRRADIAAKFDSIVEFSGVEAFIDTQVKRYSSGMNARLGFSIAVHLDPDVLLIDEVLSVGDRAFQARAFGRIREKARSGVPVVLVSHQLDRVAELSTKAIVLDHGEVRAMGAPTDCIAAYLASISVPRDAQNAVVENVIRLSELELETDAVVMSGEPISVRIRGEIGPEPLHPDWVLSLRVTQAGDVVHAVPTSARDIELPDSGPIDLQGRMQMNLPPGHYSVEVALVNWRQQRDVICTAAIDVHVLENRKYWGTAQLNSEWLARS